MILPLQQQVAPLELCRRLKELGAPQDSEFVWLPNTPNPVNWCNLDSEAPPAECAAYTVAELGVMLPASEGWSTLVELRFEQDARREDGVALWNAGWDYGDLDESFSTEAEARAKLLIDLVERGLIGFAVMAT